jgi:hypothetical protein
MMSAQNAPGERKSHVTESGQFPEKAICLSRCDMTCTTYSLARSYFMCNWNSIIEAFRIMLKAFGHIWLPC